MLGALPVDTGMAFVLVPHLSPSHASHLAEILARSTGMPVTEVQDEPRVEPNHVYVIPPDRDMVLGGGRLHLLPRHESRGQHRPIDIFLNSLAVAQKHRSIGVILSGTASDGTQGLREIKGEGGITFAQDETAQQQSMPRSAVASGCVDFVLPPGEIAREIGRIARHPLVARPARAARRPFAAPPELRKILDLVQRGTGVDFGQYKANTLYRRIARRIVVLKLDGLEEYARHLARHPAEVEALYADILISVTSFFRNPEMFEELKAKVLPRLFEHRSRLEPLRVWVPACSTGEEAYSLAIACDEFIQAAGSMVPIQVFATDLNGAAIDRARRAVYSKTIAQDVSAERLRRYFTEADGSYRVSRAIRETCVFARHNIMADPPFSQLDLISCRNLLIYFDSDLQRRIVPLLHYALRPSGFLVLGSSEAIGTFRSLFEIEDAKHKIYVRRPGKPEIALARAAGSHRDRAPFGTAAGNFQPPAPGASEVQKEADRVLMARYVPAAVLVDPDLEIVQFRGDTGAYLAPMPGKASLNLLRMAREGLLVGLRAALARARKQQGPAREEGLRVRSNGGVRTVNLEVVPVGGGPRAEGGLLVVFEEPGLQHSVALPVPGDMPAAAEPEAAGAGAPPVHRAHEEGESGEQELQRLKQELAATRDYLQSVIEQQEAANEELQSANEEVQSTNEELQSINEELETSKEEIQSSNEELATVNDELQNRNAELDRANDDLLNLLASVQLPMVMLGPDLRVRRYTPMAERVFNLIPGDIGRPIGDIKLRLSISDLTPLLEEVIDTAIAQEREVQDTNGRWYLLRLRPYRTQDNRTDGAVIVLIDVDSLTRSREYAESIVAAATESMLVLDGGLRVKTANLAYCQTFRVSREETEGRLFSELCGGQWDKPELHRLMQEVLPRDGQFDDVEATFDLGPAGRKTVTLNARRLPHEGGPEPFTLVAIHDVTARKDLEADLQRRVAELAAADRTKNEFLALLAHELRNPLAPLANALALLETPEASAAAQARAKELMGRQVQHMTQMIDDLLDVARILQGKVRLRRRPVEVAEALTEAVELVQVQADVRGQELSFVPPPHPVWVSADPVRLEQVFGNLLFNACKFTPRGGHIEVRTELVPGDPEDDGAGEVVVRVKDDGIGIDEETLLHVFEPFVQADRTLERTRGGLGIGLTLVRRLLELHGGTVEARSDGPGKGAEFSVRLAALGYEPAAKAGSRQQAAAGPAPASGPRRILVVDDNLDTAESLALLLRFRGHRVEVAHAGDEAVETAKTFHPEVVLLDIGLPGQDGYQVAKKLRQMRRTARSLIVALTGYGQEADRRRALAAGFDAHFVKPVAPETLFELVDRLPPRD